MLTKESKIRILENFISMDYLFFGKPISEMTDDTIMAKQYLELKGSLCSALTEMYDTMKHHPNEFDKIIDEQDITKLAIEAAVVARKNTKSLLVSPDGKTNITESVFNTIRSNEDADVDSVVNYTIQEKAFQLGMDNMLIARSLSESENIDVLNTFEGKILEDTYKSIRDSLVETALMIIG